MNLVYVESFYRVATLGSVSAAANVKPKITQTAMTKRVQVLEEELGVTLLDRRYPRRVRLTPAGERFLKDAERLLELWREVRAGLGVSAEPPAVRIGAIESAAHSWLIPLLGQLKLKYPALQFE